MNTTSALISAFIAFGSNLGDRQTTLAGAYAALTSDPAITPVQASRLFETAPVGGPEGQGRFLNTVLAIQTSLTAHELLTRCMTVEQQFRRERIIRWDARTLDLDILLFGDQVIATQDLEVPHPRMQLRRFVLEPLSDVGADVIHPGLGESIKVLLSKLTVEPGDVYPIADTWT
jgi:2-amino-4-hydroxy-6-hydroxymethyldihydropteridine diphosphokinase